MVFNLEKYNPFSELHIETLIVKGSSQGMEFLPQVIKGLSHSLKNITIMWMRFVKMTVITKALKHVNAKQIERLVIEYGKMESEMEYRKIYKRIGNFVNLKYLQVEFSDVKSCDYKESAKTFFEEALPKLTNLRNVKILGFLEAKHSKPLVNYIISNEYL